MPSSETRSRKLTPAARTATRTSPSASGATASGAGISSRLSRVSRTVASSRQDPASAGGVRAPPDAARTRRRTSTVPSRSANSRSSRCASAAGRARTAVSTPSVSTRTRRPGCSACAERTRPHTGAWTRSTAFSPEPAATARRVTSTSRRSANRSSASHCCTVARTSQAARCTAAGTSSAGPWVPRNGMITVSGRASADSSARAGASSSSDA